MQNRACYSLTDKVHDRWVCEWGIKQRHAAHEVWAMRLTGGWRYYVSITLTRGRTKGKWL